MGVALTKMSEAFKKQKEFFATGATRNAGWRKGQIMALMKVITEAADRISTAQAEDGVCPSSFQGAAGMLTGAAYFYMGNIDGWSAPKDLVDTLPAERRNGIECDWSCVMEPKGVVLNIAPWNAPILLSVLPCLGALAAGNCCVIKPPEHCPKTSALLVELIGGALAPEAVTVVEGGPEVCEGLIDLGFDHIMFTGGTEIGKLVMARAARTLTPVTLELGGKNPVMIDSMGDGMLNAVIAEIVSTKQNANAWLAGTSSGSLAINTGPMRMQSNFNAAIHGVGNSGLGGASIWGEHVFTTFSH